MASAVRRALIRLPRTSFAAQRSTGVVGQRRDPGGPVSRVIRLMGLPADRQLAGAAGGERRKYELARAMHESRLLQAGHCVERTDAVADRARQLLAAPRIARGVAEHH